jgi:hypothetical protein
MIKNNQINLYKKFNNYKILLKKNKLIYNN